MKTFYIIQKATGNKLDHGNFETLEAALSWWDSRIKSGTYGRPEVPEVQEVTETVMVDIGEGFQEEQTIVVVPYQAAIPAEFEIVFTDITDEIDKQQQIAEALNYIQSTDWYYARELDEPTKKMPPEVLAERIRLRALINTLEE